MIFLQGASLRYLLCQNNEIRARVLTRLFCKESYRSQQSVCSNRSAQGDRCLKKYPAIFLSSEDIKNRRTLHRQAHRYAQKSGLTELLFHLKTALKETIPD